jgi:hypothetical protein
LGHEEETLMDMSRFDSLTALLTRGLSRRAALQRLGGSGLAAAVLGTVALERSAAAAQATPPAPPPGWHSEHLVIEVTPVNAVTITRAGSGPPQRGDFFYVDAPIFAAGNVNGTEIGRYQCFGVWTHAATDTSATDQRLTSVQFRFAEGAITGIGNEGGTANYLGSVQGGTGKYTSALGSFQQTVISGGVPGVATPGATPAAPTPGTPAAGQIVVHTVFDLLLPGAS